MAYLRNNDIRIGTVFLLCILAILLVDPSIAQESTIILNSSHDPVILRNLSQMDSAGGTLTYRYPPITMGNIPPDRLNSLSRSKNNISNNVSNRTLYLFSWDEIPGNDTGRLIRILKNVYRIEWAESAKIEKIDNGKTIKVSTDKNSLSLELNDEKTKVNLTIDGNRIDEFIVRMKNSRPYIFKNFMGKAAQATSNLTTVIKGNVSRDVAQVNVKRSKFDIKSLKKEHKPGELLVKYSNTSKLSTNDFKDYYKSQNITLIKNYPRIGYHLIRVDESRLESTIKALSISGKFENAEPNYIVKTLNKPDDPHFDQLWGMDNTGQTGGSPDADIDAPEAWNISTGDKKIIVAVIDTGVDYTHEDLAGNMWTNPGEIPDNGIDDDHNGFVDDYYGWDFAYNDNNTMDGNSHGTHVSGTIGGIGNNGKGVAGVSWKVSIMAVKFLDDSGSGYISDAVDAINYATMMGADIMSNSWGGFYGSSALEAAIRAADDPGILFVAAAGNNGWDTDEVPNYPSGYDVPNIISVAATDHNDTIADFSNYGNLTVDLGAPGVDVLSSVPGNGYDSYSGTSMAVPHVSGAAALLKAFNPSLTHHEIKNILMNSVDPLPSLNGKTVSGGRLNVYKAINIAPRPVNLIKNPGFENDKANWTFYTNAIGTFTVVSPGFEGTKAARIAIVSNGSNIQLYQTNIALEPKGIYRLSFSAYSTTGHEVIMRLYQNVYPYTEYGLNKTFDLGTNWQTFTTDFTATNIINTVNNGRFIFWLAPFVEAGDTYYIDDVRLIKIGVDNITPEVIRNTPIYGNSPVTTQINVTFSEAMNKTSAQSAFSTSPATKGNFSWSNNTMIYTPGSNLTYNTTYTVTVGTGAKDLAGNSLQSLFSWQFGTFYNVYNINKGTNYSTIQAAIDDANPGNEIYVDNSIYHESLNISKRLILRGKSNFTTIIEGNGKGNVVEVHVNGVLIDGFSIRNGSKGIYVASNSNVISNNVIMNMQGEAGTNNGGSGGPSSGIYISVSTNNTLTGNTISNMVGGTGGDGKELYGGSGGTASGIYLLDSKQNTLTNNTISNIIGGTGGYYGGPGGTSAGVYLSGSANNTLTGNMINNMVGGTGGVEAEWVGSGGTASGIYLSDSTNNTLTNNTISNIAGGTGVYSSGLGGTSAGIYLSGSTNNNLTGNTISNIAGGTGGQSDYFFVAGGDGGLSFGIYLTGSPNNTLMGNTISNITGGTGGWSGDFSSGGYSGRSSGIYLTGSPNNTLTGNMISYITGGMGGMGGYLNNGADGGLSSGIYLKGSLNNTFTGNMISYIRGGMGGAAGVDGTRGIDQVGYGIFLERDSYQNVINSTNTLDGYSILYLYDVNGAVIENHILTANSNPTNLGKIVLINSNHTIIRNNTISNMTGATGVYGWRDGSGGLGDTASGIFLYGSINNIITDNKISNMTGGMGGEIDGSDRSGGPSCGIYISNSTNNTFTGNTISNMTGGDGKELYGGSGGTASGIFLYSSTNSTFINNMISNMTGGSGGTGWDGGSGGPSYGVYLSDSSNNTLTGNTISNMTGGMGGTTWDGGSGGPSYGVYLSDSSNNTLTGNTISNMTGGTGGTAWEGGSSGSGGLSSGIHFSNSTNNILSRNIASNSNYSLSLNSSSKNTIYDNIFTSTNDVQFYGSNVNTWNITRRSGANIIGGQDLGGNFWANSSGTGFSQTCSDSNNDGICDLKYTLNSNNIDYLPLKYKSVATTGITVNSPNGGETWIRGTTQTIRWNSIGSPGAYVKIELLKAGVVNRVIISSTPNDGSHPWLIPATQAPGSDYKVRITSTTNAAYTDTSDGNFTIPVPTITVLSPNGTDTWTRGTTKTIKWNSTGSPGAYVKIELLKAGLLNRVIISSTPNDGSHPWPILATQLPGSDYKVRITSATNAAYNDTSEDNFTIPIPSFKVVSPNGSENWTRGTTQTIRWNSTESPGTYVKIELLRPGKPNQLIISATLNDGSHPWLIPAAQAPGTDYKVKITSTINVSNNDTSDNNFTIAVPSFKIVFPNGGENWIRGTTQTIRWNSTESPGTYVKIELLKPGVINKVIVASTLNDGSHPWLIPASQAPGTDYKVRITSTINASNNDTSDDNFIIPDPTITVISPNGGENWRRGINQTIKWNSTGSPGAYVKIELLKAGILNRIIVASTLNDGLQTWLIPATQTAGTDYKVKITSISNLSYYDVGNNNFSIGS